MKNGKVHVVATGLRCALGLDATNALAAIRAGVSLLSEHRFLCSPAGAPILCAMEPTIDSEATARQRIIELTQKCLEDLVGTSCFADTSPVDIQLLLALPEPRPGFTETDALVAQQELNSLPRAGTRGFNVQLVGQGHAGAFVALRAAAELVLSGQEQLVVVGGADSYLDSESIEWLDRHERLFRDGIRAGFPPGEGVALLAVASEEVLSKFNLLSLGVIRGVGCATDDTERNSKVGPLGRGLTSAVMTATQNMRFPQELISDLYGDINGERGRTEDWGFTLLRTAQRFRDGTDYVSWVGKCGDLGAASAAFGCALGIEAWRLNCAKGDRALVWAGSWNGLRGAALLERDPVKLCPQLV